MADVKLSVMPTVTPVTGAERILTQAADGAVILPSAIAAYTIDVLAAAASAAPTAGDLLSGFRSTDEKRFTLDAVASYVVASAWGVASAATPAVSGDLILALRGSTVWELDIDTIKTYSLVGIQATVLNTSGLGSATLGATDIFTVCQTTTAKKTTLADIETKLWVDFRTYVTGLEAVGTATDSDIFYVSQSGIAKYCTATILATYMSAEIITIGAVQTSAHTLFPAHVTGLTETTTLADADVLYILQAGTAKKVTMATVANYAMDATFELPWQLIEASKYTALPPTTSTLTMSDTSDISIGDPIKFVWSGATYYAVVTNTVGGTITISGAPFSTTVSLTDLYVGPASHVVTRTYSESIFGGSVNDILSSAGRYDRWEGSPAFLVAFAATVGTADTGAAQPKINVKIATAAVSTNDSNKGLQVSATPGTWVASSAVTTNTANYDIARGNAIEIRCTEAGTNGDAVDLSVTLTFVYE